jgi:VanZ family protein
MYINYFVKRWAPLLIWMSAIFLFSAQPSSNLPSAGTWDLVLKKSAHFVAYAILGILIYRVVGDWKRPFLTAFLFSVVYAISDEYHQTFVPSRNGSVIDVLIDALGAAFGLWLIARNKLNLKWIQPAMSASDQL